VASHRGRNDIRGVALGCLASVAVGLLLVASAGARSNARGWHRADLIPVTQPVGVGGQFVLYDGSGRRLHVVALDARTGKSTWTKLASISDVTPGVAPWLDVSGSRIIALLSKSSAAGKDVAVMSAIEASTGAIIWASLPGRFTSMPSPCPGEPKVICVTGSLVNGTATGGLRFDLATGRALASIALGAGGARILGDGLLDPGLRKPDYLVAVHASAIAWRSPLATIFGPGSSSDYGWNFSRVEKSGLFVGSVGFTPRKQTRTFVLGDLSKQMTAGFRITDGSIVWRNRGAIFACGPLPCPGQWLAGYADQGAGAASEPVVGLRLRMSGTLKVTFDALKFTASPDASATLEGFDLANGRTIWHFNAGRSVGLITQALQPPTTGTDRILLRGRSGGYVDLNLRTGARQRVARTTPAWCRSATFYRQAVPYVAAGHSLTKYVGQPSLFPCNATGRRLSVPARVPPIAGSIGARSNGFVAWSDNTGVIAIRAS
jgi:outer membrane protein assembly factor BamB